MTNKFAPTYRSLEASNYFFGSYMTHGRQRVKLINHVWIVQLLYRRFVCFELIRCGATVSSGGLAYFQMWSKAETFQKDRTYFISEPKWPLLDTKQLWQPKVLLFNASLIS